MAVPTATGAFADLADEVACFLDSADQRRAEFWKDPSDFYRRLRQEAPVYRAPDGRWLLSSYDVANALHLDGAWKREPEVDEDDLPLGERVFRWSITFRDPPAHTRLRKAVNRLFTKRAIARRRERVAEMIRDGLEPYREQPEFDFRNGPAYDLPVAVIGEIMGLRPDDVADFSSWSNALLSLDEHGKEPEVIAQTSVVAQDALDFFNGVIDVRRRDPGDDVVSWLLAGQDSDQALDPEAITALCIQLHIGGHTTTTDLMATGLYHLLRNPDVYQELRADPSKVPAAVEEMLRIDGPVSVALARIAPRDMELGGTKIAEGEEVHAIVAAANRDPSYFEDPDRFDIRPRSATHFAFGAGMHFCLGAHLARLEAEELFYQLATELPALRPTADLDDLDWMPSYIHRGLTTLPVAW